MKRGANKMENIGYLKRDSQSVEHCSFMEKQRKTDRARDLEATLRILPLFTLWKTKLLGYDRFQKVAITFKTKGGLDFLSFDDLYNKLRTLEIDVKGGLLMIQSSAASSHSALFKIANDDFDQNWQLDLEELASNGRWQCFLFELWIEKRLVENSSLNNKDCSAWYDKKKVRCSQMVQSWAFLLENVQGSKKVDFKDKWSDHESEDMEKGASEVYGMIAGYGDDAVIPAVDAADGVSTDGIFADGVFVAAGNGSDGVSVAAGVGADGNIHDLLPNKPDIDDTQFTYGSKSNNYFESNSVSNDFVSCETSDKSSDSETTGLASCTSSVNSSSTMTKCLLVPVD
ncbi:hypothetical protein Tco_1503669 [Tanacetum coccineum]